MSLLNDKEIKSLIEGVWKGKYNQEKLPYWLFDKLATGLQTAAETGWGNELGKGAIADLELEKSFRENIYYFAAHKTAHELKDLQQLFLGSRDKYDFVKRAMSVNKQYNFHWYNTEANVTTRLARSGREWRRIENTKDIYPLLRFLAVQDANTRAEHAALHNVVRPVDDDFWKTYFPPLSWNCRCRTERVQAAATTSLEGVEMPPVQEQFRERVTESKRIWNEKHPYFQGLGKPVQRVIEAFVEEKKKQVEIEQVGFAPAKTIKEAEDWAMRNLNIQFVSFKGLDLEVANDINLSVYNIKKLMPQINTFGIGSAQMANKAMKDMIIEEFRKSDWYRDISTRMSRDTAERAAKSWASRYINQVGSNVVAWSTNVKDVHIPGGNKLDVSKFKGVFVNEKYGKSASIVNNVVKENEASGFYTKGAKNFGYIMSHEIGHEIDKTIGFQKTEAFKTIYNREHGKGIQNVIDNLSKYGATAGGRASHKPAEFIAESWAEFVTSPTPRPIAKEIGEEMLKQYHEYYLQGTVKYKDWREQILKTLAK